MGKEEERGKIIFSPHPETATFKIQYIVLD